MRLNSEHAGLPYWILSLPELCYLLFKGNTGKELGHFDNSAAVNNAYLAEQSDGSPLAGIVNGELGLFACQNCVKEVVYDKEVAASVACILLFLGGILIALGQILVVVVGKGFPFALTGIFGSGEPDLVVVAHAAGCFVAALGSLEGIIVHAVGTAGHAVYADLDELAAFHLAKGLGGVVETVFAL